MWNRLLLAFLWYSKTWICMKVSGSSIVPNWLERWDPTSGCNGPREVWGLHISGDVVSRCRTRGMSREIHCDEYLRLRLRKSKAIRFNRRERRYETRESHIDFPCPRAAFSLEICWLFERRVTFLYYIGPRYVISRRKDGRRKFIISSRLRRVIYVRRFDSRGFQSRRARPTPAIHRTLIFV